MFLKNLNLNKQELTSYYICYKYCFHRSWDSHFLSIYKYSKCSKISNTSCHPKRPRQTGQTQIRLQQSDRDLPCLLFWQAFCEFHSKILNITCHPKRPRQTGQTQTRLLLKKQSDQGLHCLLFWQAFCEFQLQYPTFYNRTDREKRVGNFRAFIIL